MKHQQASLPKIAVLATGGTLASVADSRTHEHYSSASLPIEGLIGSVPELTQLAEIHCEQIAQVFSHEMTYDVWLKLAKRAYELLEKEGFDGVVVTHGTDTMEETAYFINLIVNTDKPIIFTGAMRPANSLSSDGLRNLYNAVALAVSPEARGKGVLLTLNDMIHYARDVTKANVYTPDSFRAPELGILGYAQGTRPYFYRCPLTRHTIHSEFDIRRLSEPLPKVDIIYSYIGNNRSVVDAAVNSGAVGLISAGLGQGHQTPEVWQALIEARQRNVIVVRGSRVENGVVTRNSEMDDKHDFVASNNLNPQKARILLMLALTRTQDTREIQRIFNQY